MGDTPRVLTGHRGTFPPSYQREAAAVWCSVVTVVTINRPQIAVNVVYSVVQTFIIENRNIAESVIVKCKYLNSGDCKFLKIQMVCKGEHPKKHFKRCTKKLLFDETSKKVLV